VFNGAVLHFDITVFDGLSYSAATQITGPINVNLVDESSFDVTFYGLRVDCTVTKKKVYVNNRSRLRK
jgi:hypothetical protein